MNYGRAVAAVTRWEFQRYIKWRQQIVGLLITMVIFGAFTILPRLVSPERETRTVAVVGADILPVAELDARDVSFVPHDANEAGQLTGRVEQGTLDGLLIIHDEDRAELVARRQADWQSDVHVLLTQARQQQRIEQAGLSAATLATIMAPADLEMNYVERGASADRSARITAIVVISVMLFTVFIGISYIFGSVTGEKQIRVTEQVITAIPAQAWIDGKILGLMLVSVIGVAVQVLGLGAVFMALRMFFDAGPLPLPDTLGNPLDVTLIIAFAVLGLFFWFAFFGAIAATIDDPQHSARGSFLFVPILMTVPAYMVPGAPGSTFSRFLSLFPATSPSAMPARMLMSDVGVFEILASVLLLVASIALLRTAAGRIFRAAMLMYGKEPSWAEMRRWMFER